MRNMRKILTVLVLLVCITTVIFAVGCEKKDVVVKDKTFDSISKYEYTGSFSGNGVAWLDEIAAASDVMFAHHFNNMYNSETLDKVSYKDITIEDDLSKNSYLTYYCNVGEDEIDLIMADTDPFIYNGETFYLTVSLDKIPVKKDFKILFVQTIWAADWSSAEVSKEKAILFTYVGA